LSYNFREDIVKKSVLGWLRPELFVLICIILLPVLVIMSVVHDSEYWQTVTSFLGITTGRMELLEFRQGLHIGQSDEEITTYFALSEWRHLVLKQRLRLSDMWLVTYGRSGTPKKWILWLQFNNGILCGIRFRYLDSYTHKPMNAPVDEIDPEAPLYPSFDIIAEY
jgi:hypothetical protein